MSTPQDLLDFWMDHLQGGSDPDAAIEMLFDGNLSADDMGAIVRSLKDGVREELCARYAIGWVHWFPSPSDALFLDHVTAKTLEDHSSFADESSEAPLRGIPFRLTALGLDRLDLYRATESTDPSTAAERNWRMVEVMSEFRERDMPVLLPRFIQYGADARALIDRAAVQDGEVARKLFEAIEKSGQMALSQLAHAALLKQSQTHQFTHRPAWLVEIHHRFQARENLRASAP